MDALKRFEGANAVGTLVQLVGSLCFFYVPHFGLICLYEDVSGQQVLLGVVVHKWRHGIFGPLTPSPNLQTFLQFKDFLYCAGRKIFDYS